MITRRSVIKTGLAGAAILPTLSFAHRTRAQDGVIKVGYVSPQTGPLAPFGEADNFVVEAIKAVFKDGLTVNNKAYGVDVIVKDSQSNPNRAAEVASELILSDEVNLILVSSTPETTNPVADQCEANGVPCISTVAPWQPYFFGRGGNPDQGFEYTFHFFWGLEDVIATYTEMWSKIATNKVIGGMFPNDSDGNAWGDAELGFPKPLAAQGFQLLDPGRYQNLTDDFTAQIGVFKSNGAEILTGVMIPPDLTTFWNQVSQQGLAPKVASIGKALLFPAVLEGLGDSGNNLSTEVWWTPTHPYSSSITGASAKALADAYTAATGKQWTQPIGFAHALFEVAADALQRSGDPMDAEAVRDAIKETKLNTVVGLVDFSAGPVPNVAKTPLVGGQWRLGGDFKYDLVVTSNVAGPDVPLGGAMEAIG
ncbi:ABC transporter substrate-binding protein [Sinorhizobium meliloti]|uniref:ABC transporter substrate-binding protein n=1 Tax=Rhizobium meliloti TaxID=382 RepID=UPI003F1397BC